MIDSPDPEVDGVAQEGASKRLVRVIVDRAVGVVPGCQGVAERTAQRGARAPAPSGLQLRLTQCQ